SALAHEAEQQRVPAPGGIVISSRFIRLHDYVGRELGLTLRARPPSALAAARLGIWETVPPMSLHVGLVRASLGTTPMMDILFDTSDSDRPLRPSAYVAFHPQVPWALKRWRELIEEHLDLGMLVRAW